MPNLAIRAHINLGLIPLLTWISHPGIQAACDAQRGNAAPPFQTKLDKVVTVDLLISKNTPHRRFGQGPGQY